MVPGVLDQLNRALPGLLSRIMDLDFLKTLRDKVDAEIRKQEGAQAMSDDEYSLITETSVDHEPDHLLHPESRVTFWRTSTMPLPRTLQTLDVSEDRDELREDVLSVPPEDQPPMPVLQVDREPAVPRP